MADGITANYSFTLPEVGASQDNWGGKLNQNWDDVDGVLAGIEGDVSARILLSDIASAGQIHAGTPGKVIDAETIYAASVPLASCGAGSFAPDFGAARNFMRIMNGNITLANPTNQDAGQSGLI